MCHEVGQQGPEPNQVSKHQPSHLCYVSPSFRPMRHEQIDDKPSQNKWQQPRAIVEMFAHARSQSGYRPVCGSARA